MCAVRPPAGRKPLTRPNRDRCERPSGADAGVRSAQALAAPPASRLSVLSARSVDVAFARDAIEASRYDGRVNAERIGASAVGVGVAFASEAR